MSNSVWHQQGNEMRCWSLVKAICSLRKMHVECLKPSTKGQDVYKANCGDPLILTFLCKEFSGGDPGLSGNLAFEMCHLYTSK